MIVVADTSVLCYLVLIEQIDLLPYIFGQIAIPQAVFEELRAEKAPAQLQEWITRPPKWLKNLFGHIYSRHYFRAFTFWRTVSHFVGRRIESRFNYFR